MMKQKIFYSFIVALGLFLIVAVVGQDYTWGSESNFSKKKGYLGVSVRRLTSSLKKELKIDHGVVVSWIKEESPADDAGIMEDDVIVEVDGKKIKRPETLTRIIRKIKPGTEVKVVLYSDGKKETVDVKIGKVRSKYSFSFGDSDNSFFMIGSTPYMGVSLQELNKDLAEYFSVKHDEGALITDVEEDSPAEEAGLKAGDVILKVENEKISEPDDVKEMVAEFEEYDEISVEVMRHKKKKTFKVVLDENGEFNHNIFLNRLPKLKRLEEKLKMKLDHHKDDIEKIEIKLQKKYDDAI